VGYEGGEGGITSLTVLLKGGGGRPFPGQRVGGPSFFSQGERNARRFKVF
jgi:hypothetical protein